MTVSRKAALADTQELVARLSLAQKADLTVGATMWVTHAVPEIGLEALRLSDGPNGVRGETFDERDIALCTPCGTAVAASWDIELARRIGELLGDEARRQDVHVVLGPTLNIHRSPLGGRGFECFSEDPLLSGVVAAAWIRGVQSRGVAATPKHFVCNDAETERRTVDNLVGARALREIYLAPFELAVKAGAWALMIGYNRINGDYCSASEALVADVLKGEWGWDGLVMSDWYAHGDTAGSANAGLDLEMPGPPRLFGPALADAVRAGLVDEATLDDKVARLLRLAERVGALSNAGLRRRDSGRRPSEAEQLLRDAAAASFVLLKNEDRLLPLELPKLRKVAVIGPSALDPCYQGGGSAEVNMEPVANLLEAIASHCSESVEVVYELGCPAVNRIPALHLLDVSAVHEPEQPGLTVEYLAGHGDSTVPSVVELRRSSRLIWAPAMPLLDGAEPTFVRVSGVLAPDADGTHVFSLRGTGECRLLVDGTEIMSFSPREARFLDAAFDADEARHEVQLRAGTNVLIEIEMSVVPGLAHMLAYGCLAPEVEAEELFERAAKVAADSDAVLLVVGTTKDGQREGADRRTTALPGNQDELVRRVLAVQPATAVIVNAGSAVDMPWASEVSTILYTWFAGQEYGPALVDVLFGDREPGGRLPLTIGRRHDDYPAWDTSPDEQHQVRYRESVFVGYRHFDTADIEPEFCFGHGLGYGDFLYEKLDLSAQRVVSGEALSLTVGIRNTSDRRSKEVVQVYVHHPQTNIPRPPRELKAFAAVTLDAGAAGTVTLTLDERAFSFWDEASNAWGVEPGPVEIQVGRSSRDIRLTSDLTLTT